ncbi:hypothetical protein DFA_04634 [Cavenderia fasciculata]|uniref:Uncharacterized protein n=1 Tax=Cavenderia fasciculata TaxID=261658 RepID=F4PQ43_CACFS|nr:uncharacterized protein DFA_04634 [Cavenderia fasciculata]EGG22506.1 hypothetical protein DFA_04634 [Cavenderia fasciculata]|eukprot:XP_004360357.1 hypothetical protein DFA_04634 [Cavenderia fasciculata]
MSRFTQRLNKNDNNNNNNNNRMQIDDDDEYKDDIDEKLLKQQKEFLNSGEKPSAAVSRAAPPPIVKKSTIPTTSTGTGTSTGTRNTTTSSTSRITSKFGSTTNKTNNMIPIIDEPIEKDVISLGGGGDGKSLPSMLGNLGQHQPMSQQYGGSSPFKGQRVTFDMDDDLNDEMMGDVVEKDIEDIVDQEDHHITSVIQKIYERDVSDVIFEPPKKKKTGTSFPEPLHRSVKSFSRKPFKENVESNEGGDDKVTSLAGDIDNENKKKLETMSDQEIKDNQDFILKSLDPKLIEMLKSRGKAKNNNNNNNKDDDQKEKTSSSLKRELQKDPIEMFMDDLHKENEFRVKQQQQIKQEKLEQKEKDQKVDFVEALEKVKENEENKWMKELSDKDRAKHGLGLANFKNWRFGFRGELIVNSEDIPTHLGLHHHGQDAAEAGYTIQELSLLIRSTNHSQKTTALRILSDIFANVHRGVLGPKALVLREIYLAKLPRLLRVTLDSNIPTVSAACVACLASLCVPLQDEELYEKNELKSYRGQEFLSLKPPKPTPKPKINGINPTGNEEEEKDDDEKCVDDLVSGLIDMGVLNRLRYLLDNEKKPSVEPDYINRCRNILNIFIRFSRHSEEIAQELFKCHYLIESLCNIILLTGGEVNNEQSLLIVECKAKVIRLIRRLCQSDREIMLKISSTQHNVIPLVNQLFLSPSTDQTILLECLKFYRVHVQYRMDTTFIFAGVLERISKYNDDFSTYINQLSFNISSIQGDTTATYQSVLGQLDQNLSMERSIYNLLSVLLFSINTTNSDKSILQFDKLSSFIDSSLILIQTISVIYHTMKENNIKNENLLGLIGLFSSTIHFTTSYFMIAQKLMTKVNFKVKANIMNPQSGNNTGNKGSIMEIIENISSTIFQQSFFASTMYTDMKKQILTYSGENNHQQLAQDGELTEWWLSIARYLSVSVAINRSISKMVFYLDKSEFFTHLHSILVSTTEYRNQFVLLEGSGGERDNLYISCNRSRTYLYYHLLVLMNELSFDEEFDPSFIRFHHSASMALVHCFLPNDDSLLFNLFRSVTFNPDYLSDIGSTKSTSLSKIMIDFYQDKFFPSNTIEYSNRYQLNVDSFQITPASFIISFETYESLLPLKYDWYNLPLEYLYQDSQEIVGKNKHGDFDDGFGDDDDDDDDDLIAIIHPLIESSLQFIQCLYNSNSEYIQSIDLVNVYQSLMKVFLVKKEPWENRNISDLLKVLFNVLVSRLRAEKREQDDTIVEFDFGQYFGDRFYQFFTDFVNQFVTSSNSSPIFSTYLCIFLRQYYAVNYRRLIWSDLFPTLQYINLESDNLPLGNQCYLEPIEPSFDMIQIYKNAIIQSKASPSKAPKLYKIAKHHLLAYLFSSPSEELSNASNNKNALKIDIIKDLFDTSNKNLNVVQIDILQDLSVKFGNQHNRETTLEGGRGGGGGCAIDLYISIGNPKVIFFLFIYHFCTIVY